VNLTPTIIWAWVAIGCLGFIAGFFWRRIVDRWRR
jgi:hypothetical protein